MIDVISYGTKQLVIDSDSCLVYAIISHEDLILKDIPFTMFTDIELRDKISQIIQSGKQCDFSMFFNYLVANSDYFSQFDCEAEIQYMDSKLNTRKVKVNGLLNMIRYTKNHADCVLLNVIVS